MQSPPKPPSETTKKFDKAQLAKDLYAAANPLWTGKELFRLIETYTSDELSEAFYYSTNYYSTKPTMHLMAEFGKSEALLLLLDKLPQGTLDYCIDQVNRYGSNTLHVIARNQPVNVFNKFVSKVSASALSRALSHHNDKKQTALFIASIYQNRGDTLDLLIDKVDSRSLEDAIYKDDEVLCRIAIEYNSKTFISIITKLEHPFILNESLTQSEYRGYYLLHYTAMTLREKLHLQLINLMSAEVLNESISLVNSVGETVLQTTARHQAPANLIVLVDKLSTGSLEKCVGIKPNTGHTALYTIAINQPDSVFNAVIAKISPAVLIASVNMDPAILEAVCKYQPASTIYIFLNQLNVDALKNFVTQKKLTNVTIDILIKTLLIDSSWQNSSSFMTLLFNGIGEKLVTGLMKHAPNSMPPAISDALQEFLMSKAKLNSSERKWLERYEQNQTAIVDKGQPPLSSPAINPTQKIKIQYEILAQLRSSKFKSSDCMEIIFAIMFNSGQVDYLRELIKAKYAKNARASYDDSSLENVDVKRASTAMLKVINQFVETTPCIRLSPPENLNLFEVTYQCNQLTKYAHNRYNSFNKATNQHKMNAVVRVMQILFNPNADEKYGELEKMLYDDIKFEIEKHPKKNPLEYIYALGHEENPKNVTWRHTLVSIISINDPKFKDRFALSHDKHTAFSYYHLGQMYELGRGLQRDLKKASECYSLAMKMDTAEIGNQAAERLKAVEVVTPEIVPTRETEVNEKLSVENDITVKTALLKVQSEIEATFYRNSASASSPKLFSAPHSAPESIQHMRTELQKLEQADSAQVDEIYRRCMQLLNMYEPVDPVTAKFKESVKDALSSNKLLAPESVTSSPDPSPTAEVEVKNSVDVAPQLPPSPVKSSMSAEEYLKIGNQVSYYGFGEEPPSLDQMMAEIRSLTKEQKPSLMSETLAKKSAAIEAVSQPQTSPKQTNREMPILEPEKLNLDATYLSSNEKPGDSMPIFKGDDLIAFEKIKLPEAPKSEPSLSNSPDAMFTKSKEDAKDAKKVEANKDLQKNKPMPST